MVLFVPSIIGDHRSMLFRSLINSPRLLRRMVTGSSQDSPNSVRCCMCSVYCKCFFFRLTKVCQVPNKKCYNFFLFCYLVLVLFVSPYYTGSSWDSPNSLRCLETNTFDNPCKYFSRRFRYPLPEMQMYLLPAEIFGCIFMQMFDLTRLQANIRSLDCKNLDSKISKYRFMDVS